MSMDQRTVTLEPVAPFSFDLTAGYHTYYQARYGSDSLEEGVYRRLLDLDGNLVLASVSSVGNVEEPWLEVRLQGQGLDDESVAKATTLVSWLLGAEQELRPFYDMVSGDETMSETTRRFHGLHLPHTASVFEALVLAILGQQISTHVARVVRTLLIETCGPHLDVDGVRYYAFPRPETLAALPVEELRGMKLSWRKAEYIRGIALASLEELDGLESLRGLDDQEVVSEVTRLRGVGNWTAQWLLVRALGRPDALPLGDLALRRTVSALYFQGEPIDDAQVEEFCARWSPWRTYATVYMFAAMRNPME